jgi:hypothetical protein
MRRCTVPELSDLSDARLEAVLSDLAGHLGYPPVPDLAENVHSHLLGHSRTRRTFRARIMWRTLLSSALGIVVILTSILALSPDARTAVASWFHFAGVRIEFTRSLPGPLGHNLNLGKPASLTDARKELSFHIFVPTVPELSTPDAVYVGIAPSRGGVSLVYRPRRGIPRASTTGAGLLITEFHRRYFDAKLFPAGATFVQVRLGTGLALWLTGAPHVLYFVDENGKRLRDTIRLAGDVLIWQQGVTTIRIEGKISQRLAVEIARSMK